MCIVTDLHPQASVHSKQHERAGHWFTLIFFQHGIGAVVWSSCRVVFRCGLLWLVSRPAWMFGMATEQMAQMFGQLQQLSQQLVNQQQMFQQSLHFQRQQSQAQMEAFTNLGAAQVAKTTCDAVTFRRVFQDGMFRG